LSLLHNDSIFLQLSLFAGGNRYRSGLIGNVIAFYSYPSENMTETITCNAITFRSYLADFVCMAVSGGRGAARGMPASPYPKPLPCRTRHCTSVNTDMRYCEISKDMSSWYFGLAAFCLYEDRVPEVDTQPLPLLYSVHCTLSP
jgi:hypothetical protein